MKQYLCIYCQLNDGIDDDCYIDESHFVEHLERAHHMEVRSLEAVISSLQTLGMLETREIKEVKTGGL